MASATHRVPDDYAVILDTDQSTLSFHDKEMYPSAPLEAEDIIETTAERAREEYDAVACHECFGSGSKVPNYEFAYWGEGGVSE